MKCIYCNSEAELTSSDIITYAITGAKLTKSFVCKTHNAFTNDNYEKKFVADLDFFRNHLVLRLVMENQFSIRQIYQLMEQSYTMLKSVIESLCMHLKMLLQELMIMETKF